MEALAVLQAPSPPVPGTARSSRLDLSDVILYLLTRESVEQNKDYKLPLSQMSRALAALEQDLGELNIPVRFDRSPIDVSSLQVDEALFDLIPYFLTIVNPSFSLRVRIDIAGKQLPELRERVTPQQLERLERMHSVFHRALQEMPSPAQGGLT